VKTWEGFKLGEEEWGRDKYGGLLNGIKVKEFRGAREFRTEKRS